MLELDRNSKSIYLNYFTLQTKSKNGETEKSDLQGTPSTRTVQDFPIFLLIFTAVGKILSCCSCVTLGKMINLFEPHLSHWKFSRIILFTQRFDVKINCERLK